MEEVDAPVTAREPDTRRGLTPREFGTMIASGELSTDPIGAASGETRGLRLPGDESPEQGVLALEGVAHTTYAPPRSGARQIKSEPESEEESVVQRLSPDRAERHVAVSSQIS